MRTLLSSLLRLAIRIFFRRVEIVGAERVPAQGPVVFVLNHPNGLIDPAVLLCLAPRRVSFLAKAPLFRMPLVGLWCRAFDAIPVHRKQDPGSEMTRNRETFDAARGVLVRGGAIALFPEGTSHSDPKLKPLKTGAARIALGAAAALPQDLPLTIVPAGLYYRAKQTFRSAALLRYGDPLPVERLVQAPGAEPPADAVRALTDQLEAALAKVTLQAEEGEAHALVARAQRILSTADAAPAQPLSLAEEFELKRRILEGYEAGRRRWPDRIAAIVARMERYEAAIAAAGIDSRHLSHRSWSFGRITSYSLRSLLYVLLLLPFAIAGLIIHYPAYRVTGWVATGISKGAMDALATVKVLAAMLLFPITWAGIDTYVALRWGVGPALIALALLPLSGYAALRLVEQLDRLIGATRALVMVVFRKWMFLRLTAERRGIREEIVRLGEDLAR
jgi:1-acyl-sn-glycerol-3-phosphate acyltransferase